MESRQEHQGSARKQSWPTLIGGIAAGLGIALSVYGWIESQASIRLDVNSVRKVRVNPNLKSLEGLPEYPILKYNFMRDDIAARRDLVELHVAEHYAAESGSGNFKTTDLSLIPPLVTAETRIQLDEAARARWLEEAAALAEDTRTVTLEKKRELGRIGADLDEVQKLAQNFTDKLSEQNRFALVAKQIELLSQARGESPPPNDSSVVRQKCHNLPAVELMGTFCDELRHLGLHADECEDWSDLPYYLEQLEPDCQDAQKTALQQQVLSARQIVTAQFEEIAERSSVDTDATRATIAKVVEDAQPLYLEISVSARNETKGVANLGTAAWLTVAVDGGHDFEIKMTLAGDDTSVSPEAFRSLTYRSATWDKLSGTEKQNIELWWNAGAVATLSLEDNAGQEIVSPRFLFGDPPGDVRVRADSPSEVFWQEWGDWLRVIAVLGILAVGAALVLATRHVFARRSHLKRALLGTPDSEQAEPRS